MRLHPVRFRWRMISVARASGQGHTPAISRYKRLPGFAANAHGVAVDLRSRKHRLRLDDAVANLEKQFTDLPHDI